MNENMIKVSMSSLAPVVEEKIKAGQSVEIIVTGNSMSPLFVSGRDKVVLSPIKKLKRKQICFYRRDDETYVLHRIIKIKNNEIFCVGDNQTIIEGQLRPDQFIAVVTSFTRKNKVYSVNSFWHKFYSFIWCIRVSWRPKLFRLALKFLRKKK